MNREEIKCWGRLLRVTVVHMFDTWKMTKVFNMTSLYFGFLCNYLVSLKRAARSLLGASLREQTHWFKWWLPEVSENALVKQTSWPRFEPFKSWTQSNDLATLLEAEETCLSMSFPDQANWFYEAGSAPGGSCGYKQNPVVKVNFVKWQAYESASQEANTCL